MSLLSVVTRNKVFILSRRLIASWRKLLNCIPELKKTLFLCISKLAVRFSLINLQLGDS